jgi:RNA polymerase sigma-70 factor (sigma-E family)
MTVQVATRDLTGVDHPSRDHVGVDRDARACEGARVGDHVGVERDARACEGARVGDHVGGGLTVLPVIAEEPEGSELSVEEVFTALYVAEYTRLLRLAALLLDDLGSCEEIVQEAYIKVHAALSGPTSRLRDDDRALAYLRQTVVNLARSSLRRRLVARKHAPHPMPDAPSAEEGAYAQVERAAVVQALRGLPRRQREAVVLRYYGDLTEAAAANVMGVSTGAVKAYTSRGLAGLKLALEELR